MATVTSTIDPGDAGSEYDSLELWESGQRKNLVTSTEISVARCKSTGGAIDNTPCLFDSGWTTSADYFIKIYCDPSDGFRHSGVWDDTKYRIVPSSAASAIRTRYGAAHISIDGLQVGLYDGNGRIGLELFPNIVTPGEFSVTNTIIRQAQGAERTTCRGIYFRNATYYLGNVIVYGLADSTQTSRAFYFVITTTSYLYNCTVVNCGEGYHMDDMTSVHTYLRNCMAQDCTDGFNTSGHSGGWDVSDHCLSDIDGDATGTNIVPYGNVTFEAAGNYHLSSADTVAKDQGDDLSDNPDSLAMMLGVALDDVVSDDIDGDARSGTWDVGADEYVSADTYLYPDGIPSVSAVGAPTILRERPITVSGIASIAAVGAPDIKRERPIAVSGIASIAAVGAPDIKRERPISVSGIASVAAVGGPSILRERPITVSGIASVAAVGSPQTYSYTRQGAEPSLLLGESGYITRLGATYTGYIPDPDADPSADNGFIWTTEYRGFYSFDISPLSIAHITGAWLNFTSIAYEYEEDPPMCKMRVEAIDYDAVTLPVDLPAAWNAAIKGGGLFKIDSVDGMPDPFIGYYMDFGAIHGTDPDDLMNGDKSRIQFRTRDISGSSYDFLCLPLLSATWLDLTYTAPSGAVKKIRICAHAGI